MDSKVFKLERNGLFPDEITAWYKLIERVKGGVADQNIFATDEKGSPSLLVSFEPEPDGFIVKSALPPTATVTVRFLESKIVTIDYLYQEAASKEVAHWRERLDVSVDHAGNFCLWHTGAFCTIDDAALLILRPTKRDPAFVPPGNAGAA